MILSVMLSKFCEIHLFEFWKVFKIAKKNCKVGNTKWKIMHKCVPGSGHHLRWYDICSMKLFCFKGMSMTGRFNSIFPKRKNEEFISCIVWIRDQRESETTLRSWYEQWRVLTPNHLSSSHPWSSDCSRPQPCDGEYWIFYRTFWYTFIS